MVGDAEDPVEALPLLIVWLYVVGLSYHLTSDADWCFPLLWWLMATKALYWAYDHGWRSFTLVITAEAGIVLSAVRRSRLQ